MGHYEIDRNKKVEKILELYYEDQEVRDFIYPLFTANFVKYNGKLHIAIRHNLEAITKFILEKYSSL